VVFTGESGTFRIKKTVAFGKDGYEQLVTVEITNIGAAPADGELALHYGRAINPENEQKRSMFGGVGNQSAVACMIADDVHRRLPDDKPPSEEKGSIRWFGIDQQYFLAALYPLEKPVDGRCVLSATDTARLISAYFPISLAPQAVWSQRFGLYIGPKDPDLLAAVPAANVNPPALAAGVPPYSPQLDKAVDYGWWAVICRVMLPILKFLHGLVGNWGVAIILLTVLVKLVMLPLTHRQMVQAEQMKKLQPQMEALKKKYAEDKERQNVEMMKLYQENKVNPLGGCLPLLLQLPIWGALFQTLRTSYDLYGEPFISPLWTDLTYKDPTYVLPLALGVTMIITQRLQPQMMDATQAKVMTYFMPIFFTAIMINYPAGLSLYIFTNNLLSIAQQQLLRRYLQRKGQLTPPKDVKKDEDKKGKKAKKAEAI
jgi:YidC/Oxa1 family membrane protein insertase